MSESTQHKLSRIRPPRVQITYDVETGGAIIKKEIPFVVGILAGLSGDNQIPEKPEDKVLEDLKFRKFIEIDRDNFEKVMLAQQPALSISVMDWFKTPDLRLIVLLKEMYESASSMTHRNAKTFVFNINDASHKLLEEVNKFFTDYKKEAANAAIDDAERDASLPVIEDLLKAIRSKADESGTLDAKGNEFLYKLNKVLRYYRTNFVKEKRTLKAGFATLISAITDIPKKIDEGDYSPTDILKTFDTLEAEAQNNPSKITGNFRFNTIDDFSPVRVINQVDNLKMAFKVKQDLSDLLNKLNGNEKLLKEFTTYVNNDFAKIDPANAATPPTPLTTPQDFIADIGPKFDSSVMTESLKSQLTTFYNLYETNKSTTAVEFKSSASLQTHHILRMMIDVIAEVNGVINNQVNEFLHNSSFRKLEASWRSLHHLVKNTETGVRLKLRLLNISKEELQKDLETAVDFDQSNLFKKVYEEEYGSFGGNPYGTLLGDYEFSASAKDISLLTMISNVAAAAHSPFIAAAAPELFGIDSYKKLNEHRDLAGVFESLDMVKWNSFRESEDSRYVALTLPHVMIRLPYGPDTMPVDGFDFTENVDGSADERYLWGNSAYALVERITNAFAKYSWCAAIRGVEGGGIVSDLPAHVFSTSSGDKVLKCPTEIAITDRREKELSDLGFISLVHCKGKDYAAFFGGQTAQKPPKYDTPQANANARLSAVLPYMLAASRFAHYLKVIMRDKVGSFMSADNVQVYLNRWIGDYVLGKDDAGQEIKAKYPLREARVDVSDTPGKPGCYTAVVFLRPHFQLEELTTSIRLVAELPPPAAA